MYTNILQCLFMNVTCHKIFCYIEIHSMKFLLLLIPNESVGQKSQVYCQGVHGSQFWHTSELIKMYVNQQVTFYHHSK